MFGTPQVTEFLEGPTPLPPHTFNKEGGFQLGRASEDGCEEKRKSSAWREHNCWCKTWEAPKKVVTLWIEEGAG